MNDVQILVVVISCISAFVIGIPLLCGAILPILKPTISKKANRYLYAFSSGFFLIMSTVLFIGESKIHLEEHFISEMNNEVVGKVITAAVITSVVLGGLLLCLGIKFFFANKKGKTDIHTHNHDEMIFNVSDYNPKSKAFAIFFLLTHRIPDGIIIGLLCSQIARESINVVNIVFLCSFVIHVIPEELIIYYRQIDMGISKKRATANSLIAVGLVIPLIVIGAIIGWFSLENEIAIHVVQLIAAAFLLFISIIEFFPEFLHDLRISGKSWYITMLIFIIGIAAALFILCFHDHGTSHSHEIVSWINQLNDFKA